LEKYELLNKSGYFLISVPARQSLFSEDDTFHGHFRRYEKKDLIDKLEKTGFKIELFWTYNPFPYITRFLIKANKKDFDSDIVTRTKCSSHVYFPTTEKLVRWFYPLYSSTKFL
jgi:hypothetical protein